jgi:hypothetical protein
MDQFGLKSSAICRFDGPDACLHRLVGEFAIRVIDDGDEHGVLLSMRAA